MMIYLDNAATSFPKPRAVCAAVSEFSRSCGGNPGRGGHRLSKKAGELVYSCRENLSKLFNINNPERIAFTKNATEAINIAIKGVLNRSDHIIVSPLEHNAVMRPIKQMGISYSVAKLDEEGNLTAESFAKQIRHNTKMICCIHASNVSGYICPINEIGALCKEKKLLFLTDAAQTAGCAVIDVGNMNIDLLAFAGHKGLMGLQGTGGLYVREGIRVTPLIVGGTGSASESLNQPDYMPDLLESGTLNAPGLAGLLAGTTFVMDKSVEEIAEHERKLAARFWDIVSSDKRIQLVGGFDKPMCGVVSLALDGADPMLAAETLDQSYGIATRAGLHCAIMAHQAYGTAQTGTIRFSFGVFNNYSDAEYAAKSLLAR